MADEPQKEPKKSEEMHLLRERLYDRGLTPRKHERTELKPTEHKDIPHSWGQPSEQPEVMEAAAGTSGVKPIGYFNVNNMPKRKKYRTVFVLFGVLFFLVTLIVSSGYMFLGGNTISGDNISVSISGPFSVGGGEVMPLQIAVTNQNSASIKAATLIVRYPLGTQSPEEEGREIQREAIPLENIGAGETINVPVRAIVFGEEDEEKQIQAEVEYQLRGSNGIFFKEAEPHNFKINSSPVTISIESLKQVSSGQPVDVNMIVRSNSATPLRDLVVRAEYPFGFDYTSSKPAPISGQNVWLIPELKPDESFTISARGVVSGTKSDERVVMASVGVANDTNAYRLASVFSTADFQYEFEQEFLGFDIKVNGNSGDTVVVDRGDQVQVRLDFINPLEDSIYDASLQIGLTGTALDEAGIKVQNGFYDSIKNAILFDRTTNQALEKILPGKRVQLAFSMDADAFVTQTPEINLIIDGQAARVQESNVPEQLKGNDTRTIKFASQVDLLSSVTPQSGLIPPVAEKLTQYTVAMRVESGTNDLINGEVTASLPNYVSWLDVTSGDGRVEFRPSSRTVIWSVGNISNNDAATMNFTIGFLPSISQVGDTPTLVSNQSFKATDRFTGTIIRGSTPALTTVLSTETGYNQKDGEVRRTEND